MLTRATRTQCSRRCLHSSAMVQADAPARSALSGGRRRGKRIQLYQWLENPEGGASFAKQQSGINWLGDNIPFPNNPTFRPIPPLADADKTAIYKAFVVHKITPRQIAQDSGISIKRVEAIIRLKALENDFIKECIKTDVQNKPLQTPLAKAMDEMLGARHRLSREFDSVDELTQKIGRPTFEIREEGEEHISEAEAAQILRTKSMQQVEDQILEREKRHPFRLQQLAKVQETRQIAPKNPVEANARFNYVFVDTSKSNKEATKIRARDGSLKR